VYASSENFESENASIGALGNYSVKAYAVIQLKSLFS